MTDQLTCITNQLHDFRGCTIRDEHYTDYPDLEAHKATCNGCIQRPTRTGMLCAACYHRVEEALAVSDQWFTMLEGVDRAVTADNGGSGKPGSQVPFAPVPLAMEELISYMRSYTGTTERWVSDPAGAADAVRFARAMTAAAKAHPVAELARKPRIVRCPACSQLTLLWNPPAYFGGEVVVQCADDTCRWRAKNDSWEVIAEIEERNSHLVGAHS